MIFPILKDTNQNVKRQVIEFKGYDAQAVIDDGSMRDMMNLSTDQYPSLYPRKQRGVYPGPQYGNPQALLSRKEKLTVASKNALYYDGRNIMELDDDLPGTKLLAAINTKICVWPDKLWYNPDDNTSGSLEKIGTAYSITYHEVDVSKVVEASITGMDLTGFAVKDAINISGSGTTTYDSGNKKTNDQEGALIESITATTTCTFSGSGSDPSCQYSKFAEKILSLDQTHALFAPGNFVFTYNGTNWTYNGQTAILSDFGIVTSGTWTSGDTLTVTLVNTITFDAGVIGFPTNSHADFTDSSHNIEYKRAVPDLDHIIEYNNRLYGCKGSTIYASKLGDPTNWYYYGNGTADASYTVAVGTDGDFTGIAAFSSHILFFKENCIHKLYGYKPSNYQIVTVQCLGLEAGSSRSAKLIGDVIYYKSREGIMAYDGDLPYLVSQNFGNERYKEAAAGTDGIKYYVSMKNKITNKYYFFVYDISKGIWLIEDDTKATDFAYVYDQLVYIDDFDKKVISCDTQTTPVDSDDPIEWYAIFGDYDEFIENKKVYSKIEMRLKMEPESEVDIWMSVDNKPWETIRRISTFTRRTVELPIVPRRCDKFKIMIKGKGYTKIESMTRIVREGTMR